MGFFSIGLAKLVGSGGYIIAADVQQKMLNTLKKRAEKAEVSERIRIHRCEANNLGVETPVDFILAFWVVHEIADINMFLHQACSCLKPNGRIFLLNPSFMFRKGISKKLLFRHKSIGLKNMEIHLYVSVGL